MSDLDDLQKYVGWRTEHEDVITASQVQRMNATLDRVEPTPKDGDPIPPGWHLIFFPRIPPTRTLSRDGTEPAMDNGMPDPLPIRMFARNRTKFFQPLRIGERVRRVTEIASIEVKEGRSGKLAFVTHRYTISNTSGAATVDERDLVFLEEAKSGTRKMPKGEPAPEGATWEMTVNPTNTMLFRFSAVTFNPHRIHYDFPYVTQVEGYPGLVVHGPLTATWLLEMARNNMQGTMTFFEMRAKAPLFAGRPFRILGRPREGKKACDLWAITPDNTIAMEASATFA